ncbi:hypothetical protein CerSpe_130500 [Prunus speciosa]
MSINEARSFIKQLKDMGGDQREEYYMFIEIMKDFKAQRIDTKGVCARVKALFKGQNHLILGFNQFLPQGYEIIPEEEDATPPLQKQTVDMKLLSRL